MESRRPADYRQRITALAPDGSFLCEAPAGSGKTELLTQRFLTLLSRVNRPEELLAITFTRKATAEMRDRIISALKMAQAEEPDDEYRKLTWTIAREALTRDRESGWHLLDNPNRLQVRTFDSLCRYLSGALPLYSGFGATPEVTDEPGELYLMAIYQLFEDLEQNEAWSGALATILRHLDNNFQSLETLLISMLGRRDHWLSLVGHGAPISEINSVLEHNLQQVCDDVVARLKERIPGDIVSELVELAHFAAGNLEKDGSDSVIKSCLEIEQLPGSDETGVRQWSGILEILMTNAGSWRQRLNKNIGFPTGVNKQEQAAFKLMKGRMTALIQELEQVEGLAQALCDLKFLPVTRYDNQQLEILDALAVVLPVLVARLTLVFSEKNLVDYPEVSIRARRALGGLDAPTDLALALDHRIRHILVDEFQDVSSSQVALLKLLTAGWQTGDGHTLFCVGDAMQSIYGFRDANVGLFLHCAEHGLGGVELTPIGLNTNFRSSKPVVDWVNKIFQPVFPVQNDISSGAVTYAPSVAYDQAVEAQAVHVYGFEGEDALQQEAEAVLEIIAQTRLGNPDASIAVLVRNRSHAHYIVPALKRARLGYRAVDLEPLAGHDIIRDLMSLTHALLHPGDRIAWLSVLRAPWCGLLLNDLEAIANYGVNGNRPGLTLIEQIQEFSADKQTVKLLSEDGKARLDRVLPVLTRALAERQRKPLNEWIAGTWLALGGPACLMEEADLKNAEIFFSLLESLARSSTLPELNSLRDAVAGLYAAPDPAGDERLQIMTIHKAKGLEFDVVIVPSLHRTPRPTTGELILWQDRLTAGGKQELIMAPIPPTGQDKDRIYQYLQQEQKKKEYYESCRLLYVACTRARNRLYLMTGVSRDKKDATVIKGPAASSLLHTIWDTVNTGLELKPAVKGTVLEQPPATEVRSLRRLAVNWDTPNLTARDLLKNYVNQPEDYDFNEVSIEADQEEPQDPTARYIGTLVHQVLQEVGNRGLASWNDNRIEQSRPYWTARLATLGLAATKADDAVNDVSEIIRKVIVDENFQWMFSNKHEHRYSEYPVTLSLPRGYRNLVIDLLIQEQDGSIWIIDYKTGRPGPDETVDEFVTKRRDSYRNSMALYREAVTQLGYRHVRTALYFPQLARWVEYGEG